MTYTLTMTAAEYEQVTCDIECAVEELSELSRAVSWYATELPERLETVLTIVRGALRE